MDDERQPKLAANLCRMNYERSSRRRKLRFRRRLRLTIRDFFWLMLCAALITMIWADNAHYRRQVNQIQYDAKRVESLANQKLKDVATREDDLKTKEQALEVRTKLLERRLGQLTAETSR